MANEPSGQRNPRMYDLIKDAPKTGKSPTIWSFPAVVGFMKVAGQPVAGPWPPHQQPRPDPEDEALPVAIAEPAAAPPTGPQPAAAPPAAAPPPAGDRPRSSPGRAAENYARQRPRHL